MNNRKPKTFLKKNNVKLIIALSLILILLGYLVSWGYMFLSTDVEVFYTNLSPNSVSMIWVTDRAEPGMAVALKEERGDFLFRSNDESISYDDRDYTKALVEHATEAQEEALDGDINKMIENIGSDIEVFEYGKYKIHHVTLRDLDPETKYYVMVKNGGVFRKPQNSSFTTKALTEDILLPSPAYGLVVRDEGGLLLDGGVMRMYLIDEKKERMTNTISTPISNRGSWYLDLSRLYNLEGEPMLRDLTSDEFSSFYEVHEVVTDEGVYQMILETGLDAPSPEFIMSKASLVEEYQVEVKNDFLEDLFPLRSLISRSFAKVDPGGASGGYIEEDKEESDEPDEYQRPSDYDDSYEVENPNVGGYRVIDYNDLVPVETNEDTGGDDRSETEGPTSGTPEDQYSEGSTYGIPQEPYAEGSSTEGELEAPPPVDPYVCCKSFLPGKESYVGDTSAGAGDNCLTGYTKVGTAKNEISCDFQFTYGSSGVLDGVVGEPPVDVQGQKSCCNKSAISPGGLWGTSGCSMISTSYIGEMTFSECKAQVEDNILDFKEIMSDIFFTVPESDSPYVSLQSTCCYDSNSGVYSWVDNVVEGYCGKIGQERRSLSNRACISSNPGDYEITLPYDIDEERVKYNVVDPRKLDTTFGYVEELYKTAVAYPLYMGNVSGTNICDPTVAEYHKGTCDITKCGEDTTPRYTFDSKDNKGSYFFKCVRNDTPQNSYEHEEGGLYTDCIQTAAENHSGTCDPADCGEGTYPKTKFGLSKATNGTKFFSYYQCVIGEHPFEGGISSECNQFAAEVYGAVCDASECPEGAIPVARVGPDPVATSPAQAVLLDVPTRFVHYVQCIGSDIDFDGTPKKPKLDNWIMKDLDDCKFLCTGNDYYQPVCSKTNGLKKVKSGLSLEEKERDDRCHSENYVCSQSDGGDTWTVWSVKYQCGYKAIQSNVSQDNKNVDKIALRNIIGHVGDLLNTPVYAQEAGENDVEVMDIIFDPENGSYLFGESGTYYFIYEDQLYQVKIGNGPGNYLIYLDIDGDNLYDPDIDVRFEVDPMLLSFSKQTSAYHYKIRRGFNFVSFDFIPDEYSSVAKEFLSGLNSRYNDAFYSISTFDSGEWKIVGERKGIGYGVDNFQIVPGVGYIIRSRFDVDLYLSGFELLEPVPINLDEGWNLVSVHGVNDLYTARSLTEELVDDNFEVNVISKWDSTVGKYEGLAYQQDDGGNDQFYGFDYPILKRSAYFIRVMRNEGVWIP